MNRQRSFRSVAPVWAALTVPVLWLAALLATGYEDGMTVFSLFGKFDSLMEHPFSIRWTPHTLKFMGIALLIYAMALALYYSSQGNRRPGEEYGSAKWGDPVALGRKYMDSGKTEIRYEPERFGRKGETTFLIARWKPKENTVVFTSGEGGTMDEARCTVRSGEKLPAGFTVPKPKPKKGLAFSDLWVCSEDSSLWSTVELKDYVVSGRSKEVVFAALYGDEGKHTVIFLLGGGSYLGMPRVCVQRGAPGEPVLEPAVEAMKSPPGYEFDGWSASVPERYGEAGKTTVRFAQWKAKENTVLFRQGEYGTMDEARCTVRSGEKLPKGYAVTEPKAKDGYIFAGLWRCDEDGSVWRTSDLKHYIVTGESEAVKFTALYHEAGKHTLAYLLGEGAYRGSRLYTVTGEPGEGVIALDTEKLESPAGYEFDGFTVAPKPMLPQKRGRQDNNVILTQHVKIGMDGYKHNRNLNVLVVGGAGAGKTQGFCIPGLMSANASFLVTDPKGEMLRATGQLLRDEGYDVKVFNLDDPEQSDHYNPFVYLHKEEDALKLIDNLIRNTTPKNSMSNDPFWERAEIALDSALMLYLVDFAEPEEQNFETLLYMLGSADAREEDEDYVSALDLLFEGLEEEYPEHASLKQYRIFKQAPGKTAKSILISAGVRLAAFNIQRYAGMTCRDDMDFATLGEKKRAIFCVIPVIDTSMNYLVGMLYTQCFQELYRLAKEKYNGRLPRHVRVIQDEWANVAQPDSYPKVVSTCRGFNIGLNIIVQNIQQVKAIYEKEWESILGNCDTLLFLGGGNEPTSLEFMSKMLGKETLDTRTRGQTKGRAGGSSTNYQQAGRELMMIDEIRKMDTNAAIVLIRGECPVIDKKYDVRKHPNFKRTLRGGAAPYVHRPAVDYALPDLPYAVRSLNNIEIIDDMEENENA